MDGEVLKKIISKVVQKMASYKNMAILHPQPVPIGVSNRHMHLSQGDVERLFGKGYEIVCQRDLSQPGQCAAFETVLLAGPKGSIDRVRVLGPARGQTQVEILRSDTFQLGIKAPIRESGDLAGSGGITIIGPAGSVCLEEGVIIAQRHIHMTPHDADLYGIKDRQMVQMKYQGERGAIFDNVIVRVSDQYALEFHIDADEANGMGIEHGDEAYLLVNTTCTDDSTTGIPDKSSDKVSENGIIRTPRIEEPIKLVTEETVRDAWNTKAILTINKGVICTPLARDTIKELGVEVIWK
ncbi:MAG: phosphate propanoyltransferase [Clostridiales bacterium]|nr:phosphate propanoyltransferase [Clostridiales bacterium]